MFDFKPFENNKDFIFHHFPQVLSVLIRHHGLQHFVVNTP